MRIYIFRVVLEHDEVCCLAYYPALKKKGGANLGNEQRRNSKKL